VGQYDVHRTRAAQRKHAPYLVVLQSDLVNLIRTAVIAPLRPLRGFGRTADRLHVMADFAGEPHVLSLEEMASVPREVLGEKVGSLGSCRAEILSAIDLLFTGI